MPSEGESFTLKEVQQELEHFYKLITRAMQIYGGSQLEEDIYLLAPANQDSQQSPWKNKRYPLAVSAVIHGDEVGGLASLNLFLEQVLAEGKVFSYPLIVFLGNVRALQQGERYIDGDLNRCFNLSSEPPPSHHHELKRAEVLKPILSEVAFYFDMHQTIRHSPHGFFIFDYHPERWHFARSILPRQPVVTYWGRVFTLEGICGDQFVNSQGGVAVTLELGWKGFNPWQVALGAQGLRAAYEYVKRRVVQNKSRKQIQLFESPLIGTAYTWADVIPYPATGEVIPTMPFSNFVPLEKGTVLAQVDGKPLKLRTSGLSLFPAPEISKAHRPPPQGTGKDQRPYELLRILKPITAEDLPFIAESSTSSSSAPPS